MNQFLVTLDRILGNEVSSLDKIMFWVITGIILIIIFNQEDK